MKRSNKENDFNTTPLKRSKQTPAKDVLASKVSNITTSFLSNKLADLNISSSNNEVKLLHELLWNAKQHGKYSTEGEAHEMPTDIGLHVKDYGHVEFPLTENKGDELISFNFVTLVDKKVKNTFYLNPDCFEIRNSKWNEQMAVLLRRIGSELGCNCILEAKLIKLLLCKKGIQSLKQTDTEKENNMFGSLVIQLPSAYEGGEFVFNECHEKTVFDLSQKAGKSQNSIYYLAHYSDIGHESLRIKKGYRVALVYSLFIQMDHKSDRNVNMIDLDKASKLSMILQTMSRKNIHIISMMLKSQYTKESIEQNGFNALNSIDYDRYSLLKNASKLLPFEDQFNFYIVKSKLAINSSEYNMYSTESKANAIKKWWDEDGFKVNILEDYIEPDKFFDLNFNPDSKSFLFELDKEDDYGPMVKQKKGSKEGENYTTSIYNKYLMVFWPKKYEVSAYLKMNYSCGIDYLEKLMKEDFLTINDFPFSVALKDWETIKEHFSKRFLPVSYKNIINSCKLTKILLKLNQLKTANMCFKEIVLPMILKNLNELSNPNISYFDSTKSLCESDSDDYYEHESNRKFTNYWVYDKKIQEVYLNYYHLAEIIMSFENKEDHMEKLVDYLIQSKISCTMIKPLISDIIKNFSTFSSSKAVLKLFNWRLSFIANTLKTMSSDKADASNYPYGFRYDDYSHEQTDIQNFTNYFEIPQNLEKVLAILTLPWKQQSYSSQQIKLIYKMAIGNSADKEKLLSALNGVLEYQNNKENKYNSLSIEDRCFLVQIALKLNLKEKAFSLFEKFLQTYLQKEDEFIKLFEFKNSKDLNNRYGFFLSENRQNTKMYMLLRTLICFNDKDENLNKFKDNAIKCLQPKQFQSLLHEIWADFSDFQSYPSVYKFFKQRLQYLEEQLQNLPPFTWKMMPKTMHSHPLIEQFFKSEKTSLIYSDQKFKNREDLRNSLQEFDLWYGNTDGFSSNVYYRGWGVYSSVHIVKTKRWFFNKYGNSKEIKKEIELIKKQLILFNF